MKWIVKVRKHILPLCGVFFEMGAGEHLAQVAFHRDVLFAKGVLYQSTYRARLTSLTLPWSNTQLATQSRLSGKKLSAPPHQKNNCHSAGYQSPSLSINWLTGPVSLVQDTLWTTQILPINSFNLLFWLLLWVVLSPRSMQHLCNKGKQ